jgi:small-conductance mechanosensitive channel
MDSDVNDFMAQLLALEGFPLLDIAASLVLLGLLVVIRLVANRLIRSKTEASPHIQRRWTATIRNVLFFLALTGLVLIWAPQLRTFALSLTAVAVALVVATKELILCFSGSFLRASTRSFAIGDRIEIGNIRGEVVDHNIFVTALHEFDGGAQFQFTGRTAVVPNSILLNTPVRNFSLLRNFTYHSFSLTIEPTVNVFEHRDMIEAAIERHYAPHREGAVQVNAAIERRSAVDLQDALMSVRIGTTDIGKYRVSITLFCPSSAAEALEQQITYDLMSRLHDLARQTAPKVEQAGSSGGEDIR